MAGYWRVLVLSAVVQLVQVRSWQSSNYEPMIEIVIGSSLSSSLKCVQPATPANCDDAVQVNDAQYSDTFNFYTEPDGKVCAKRTDHNDPWGLHLVIKCKKVGSYSNNHVYETAAVGASLDVIVGSSLERNEKCVEAPGPVTCEAHASEIDNSGTHPDTFDVRLSGHQVCAKRTDQPDPWGLHLVVKCRKAASWGQPSNPDEANAEVQVFIGASDANPKCVRAPSSVTCDAEAGNTGRTDSHPDRFHVYHHGNEVCARRIDYDGPWGLDLVLHCRAGGGSDSYWKSVKAQWCCQSHMFSKACPFNCDAGLKYWQRGWSPAKKGWCCENRRLGCQDGSQNTGGEGMIPGTPPFNCGTEGMEGERGPSPPWNSNGGTHVGPDSNWNEDSANSGSSNFVADSRYDCKHGVREMWTQDKAQYCDLWLAAEATKSYDCSGNPAEWTQAQGDWCRNHAGGRHNCGDGNATTWTQDKFDYCCILKNIGCVETTAVTEAPTGMTGSRSNRNSWEDTAAQDLLDAPTTEKKSHETGYDCLGHDEGDHRGKFSEPKRKWCCQRWGLGCEDSEAGGATSYDCDAGYWNWKKGWSEEKQEWCCKHDQKGCSAPSPPPSPQIGSSHSTLEAPSYDCSEATNSSAARDWCCKNAKYSAACPFDCEAGLPKWKTGWSAEKKLWCCKHERLGCVKSYSCDKEATSKEGREWCCSHHKYSAACPFDCQAGLSKWQSGFSTEKKSWCCKYESLACGGSNAISTPDAYTFADCQKKVDMSPGLSKWCCNQLGMCKLPVTSRFDCIVDLADWAAKWSAEKKKYCCKDQVKCIGHSNGYSGSHSGSHSGSRNSGHAATDAVVWYQERTENIHVGTSQEGVKCVTPPAAVICPEDSGNVGRTDTHPDRFTVSRKGGQVCAERTDWKGMWGLDLVLKCIKAEDSGLEKVQIGSSLGSSTKCVAQTSPVTCDDKSSQWGRTDPHPDTFKVYHSNGQICASRVDSPSPWGVDLVLYCRKGSWSSSYWGAGTRLLEDTLRENEEVGKIRWSMAAKPAPFLAALAMLGALVVGVRAAVASRRSLFARWRLPDSDAEDAGFLID